VHELEVLHDPVAPLGTRFLAAKNLVDGERHVLANGQPRQQRVVLEDDGAVWSRSVHLLALEEDAALARLEKPGDDVEERRFPTARVADDRDVFAFVDPEADVAQHLRRGAAALERDADVVDLEIPHAPLLRPWCRG
jgi:hypothetical protein